MVELGPGQESADVIQTEDEPRDLQCLYAYGPAFRFNPSKTSPIDRKRFVIGYTIEEMTTRAENFLRGIGLALGFRPDCLYGGAWQQQRQQSTPRRTRLRAPAAEGLVPPTPACRPLS